MNESMKQAQKTYSKTEKYKISQEKYRSSEKYKQRRKDHPEIYLKGLKKMLNNNVCNILTEHAEKVGHDPERLSTAYICCISGIRMEEKS